jgi:hypothetical protein
MLEISKLARQFHGIKINTILHKLVNVVGSVVLVVSSVSFVLAVSLIALIVSVVEVIAEVVVEAAAEDINIKIQKSLLFNIEKFTPT